MANRIKDTLSPELYEYYKNHRNKYKRFASDLTLLQAKLFKGMVDDKVFPTTKKRHGWEYECDCTTWLNGATSKITTFSDFRKLYKNRLKNYKFKSPEYYAECERIVSENDVEYARNAMRAQSMRNYVARNYNAPMPQEEDQSVSSQNRVIASCLSYKDRQVIPNSISMQSNFLANEDKCEYCPTIIEYECNCNNKDYTNDKQEKDLRDNDKSECLIYCLTLIISFFVFGGIAYIFKHLLLLVWYLTGFIVVAILNIIHSIFCILFDIDGEMWIGDFPELSKIEVWQIGGCIYGFIVLAAICIKIYQAIKNRSI